MRKYYLARFFEQGGLEDGRLRTSDGHYLRASRCGIDYHPALSSNMKGRYYPFSRRQDRLMEGFIALDVPSGIEGFGRSDSVRHYLSIDHIEDILGPSHLVSLNITVLRTSL